MPQDQSKNNKWSNMSPHFARRRSNFTVRNGDVSEIVQKVVATPKDVQRALQRLEEKGYVAYKSEGDSNEIQRLYIAPIALRRLTSELELRIVSLLLGYQLTDCARIVRHNSDSEPLIVGSNVPVLQIAAYFEDGKTMEEIQEDFQDLMEDDFVDALRYYMHHRKEMIVQLQEYMKTDDIQ
jgi:uncharacterized protein (DUF433 family)/DNA-binding MarR family transcriptional regulator